MSLITPIGGPAITDREIAGLIGVGGTAVAILSSWLFYYLGESKNRRREEDRKKRESEAPSKVEKYSWEVFLEGARKVGESVISEYKPDAFIIFSGSSSIFSSLMLDLLLEREALLKARIYTARFLSKDIPLSPELCSGFEVLEDNLARFRVLLPESLKFHGDRNWKIAIIDDTTTTGMSMQLVKGHLKALGFKNFKTACFSSVGRDNFNVPDPIDLAYRYTTTNDFLFPWGRKPL